MPRLGEFLAVGAPKAFGGAAAVAANVLLLRLFGPEQFGVLSLCIAVILLADGLLGSAIDMGVLRLAPMYRVSDRARSVAIEAAAFAAKSAAFLPILLLLPFTAAALSERVFGSSAHASLLWLTCGAALGMLLLRSLLANAQVEGRFGHYAAVEWLHQGLRFGGIGLLVLIGHASAAGVLAFFVLAPYAALACGVALRKESAGIFQRPRWAVVRELFASVRWSLLTFALAALISRLDLFLLTALSSMHEVGIFSAAQVLATLPELLGTYLAIVLTPKVMPSLRDGGFYLLFRRFQLWCYAACALMLAAAFAAMESVLPAALPESFGPSRNLVMILLPGALAGLATFPLTLSLLLFVRPRFLLALDLVTAPIMIVAYLYLIPSYGAVGAAWVTSMARLGKATIAQVVAWQCARQSPDALRRAGVPALVSVPGGGSA